MDEIDIAQQNEELFRQVALKSHFAGRQGVRPDNAEPGIRLCMDCGEEIEPARLEAKPDAFRCVDCQAKKERRARRG